MQLRLDTSFSMESKVAQRKIEKINDYKERMAIKHKRLA